MQDRDRYLGLEIGQVVRVAWPYPSRDYPPLTLWRIVATDLCHYYLRSDTYPLEREWRVPFSAVDPLTPPTS
jgi:hypothetical protein